MKITETLTVHVMLEPGEEFDAASLEKKIEVNQVWVHYDRPEKVAIVKGTRYRLDRETLAVHQDSFSMPFDRLPERIRAALPVAFEKVMRTKVAE